MVVVQVTRSSSRHGESWDVFPHPNAPSRVLPLVVKRGRTTTDEIRLSLCNKKITITQIYSNENAKRRGSVKPHFWGHHWTLKETTHTHGYFWPCPPVKSLVFFPEKVKIGSWKNGVHQIYEKWQSWFDNYRTVMGCIQAIEQVSTALFHIKNLSQTVT